MLVVWFFVYKKLAQFAVPCALPPRRSESPGCAAENKPSCVLHLLGSFIGSRGFSSLEQRPEFWVLQSDSCLLPHAHILLCSHLFIYFLVLIQVTVDSNIEEVRLPILCTVKNLTLKKFQSPYSAWFHNLQIQPTKDCVILQYLLKKKICI